MSVCVVPSEFRIRVSYVNPEDKCELTGRGVVIHLFARESIAFA